LSRKYTDTTLAVITLSAGVWRIIKMTNTAMNCAKAIGIGIAAGVTAGVICKCASDRKRSLRYRARHAASVMEDLLDNVAYMFK